MDGGNAAIMDTVGVKKTKMWLVWKLEDRRCGYLSIVVLIELIELSS